MMQRLSDNIMVLGNRHFNYFVVGQKQAVIVECGVSGGVTSFQQDWLQLQDKPEISCILAMHEHFDHVCGIPALREIFPQAPVLAHSKTGNLLKKKPVIQDFFQQDDKMSILLKNEGILECKAVSPEVDILEIDQFLSEGEVIEIDRGLKMNIMETPGHSPGSISVYCKQEQLMCISDAGGYQIREKFIFPIFFQSYEMYIESIKRMSTFPTRILALPHGEIWTGISVHLFYCRALEAAEKAFACIRRMLYEGLEEQEIEKRLYNRYYRDDLMIYTPENIHLCIRLLIQRVKECLQ